MPTRKATSKPARKPANRASSSGVPATVMEVRAIREQLVKEAGGDIRKLMDMAERAVAGRSARTVTKRKARNVA